VSPNDKYATLLAGKKLWEALTDEKFPYTKCFLDEECHPTLSYNLLESEVLHVVDPKVDMEMKTAPAATFKQNLMLVSPTLSVSFSVNSLTWLVYSG